MLKNIDPALNADVLHALRAMGHGDTLVISDTPPTLLPATPQSARFFTSTTSPLPAQ